MGDEFEKLIRVSNGAKHHKRPSPDRRGRLNEAEKRYRKSKTHTGKGPTLRSKR